MTSYQANFASHHTKDRHVGFLLAWHGIGKHNKASHFYLVYTTTPTYNRMTIILAYTIGEKIKLFCKVNPKFKRFLLFFSILRHT